MITSIFLAKFLGLLIVIVTLALLFSRKNFNLVLGLYENEIPVLVKGLISVALGIILLSFHNVWATSLDIATTLFCWLIFIGGVISLFFPKYFTNMAGNIKKNKGLGTFILIIFLLIGVYFLYAGFI